MRQDGIRIGVAHVAWDPKASKASNDCGSDEMRVLTDATGESEGIDARERCCCPGDGGRSAPDEHVDREARHPVAVRGAALDLAHVGRSRDRGKSGAMPQTIGKLVG